MPAPEAQAVKAAPHISGKEIWTLTWPQALMMFFQFLVGFTDVWVAGHISRDTQAVLGIVTQCQFLLLIVGTALASGSIAAISQSLGAKLPARAMRYGGMVLKYGLAFSVVALVLAILFRRPLLVLLQVPESIFDLAQYFWLLFMASVPSNYLLSLTGAMFRARRMVFIPLGSAMLACAVNAVTATGFGLGWWGFPDLGVEGMALATFCSVTVAGFFSLAMAVKRGILRRAAFAPWRWEKRAMAYLIRVAAPAGGLSIFWQTGYLVLFAVAASLPRDSVNALAGMTAGMRVESIIFLPAIAFNMTASMLVGHSLGAGDKVEAKRVAGRIVLLGSVIMSVGALCLWPFVPRIAAFVAPDPGAQVHAIEYLKYNLLGTPFSVVSMTLGGVLSGAGAALYSFVVFSSAIWLVRLPLAWLFGHVVIGESWGVFLAMFISQVVQSLVILYVFRRKDWARFAMTAKRMKTVARKTP